MKLVLCCVVSYRWIDFDQLLWLMPVFLRIEYFVLFLREYQKLEFAIDILMAATEDRARFFTLSVYL